MSLTAGEIVTIETRNRPAGLVSGRELRRMLEALRTYQFSSSRARPLAKLCAAGVDYGWGELKRRAGRDLLSETSARARASLRRYLQKSLERITRPCFELEWTSFELAMNALGVSASDAALTERMFLRDRPWDRLSSLFQKFPVLAQLWCLTISQWRGHVLEVLGRFRRDRPALSRFFFRKSSTGAILNLWLGLSDPHNVGRSVILLEFSGSRRVIYKPRSGRSESAWFSLLAWMNRNGFQPRQRIVQVLLRKSYYWMEYVEVASCKNKAAVGRSYKRMGGLMAAAYLLRAVDCHRQNVIAAGEYPVLVDIDALWHVSSLTEAQSPADVLYRTGFLPNSKRRSLQSRSSVLGRAASGSHLTRISGKPVIAAHYPSEIIAGFSRAWACLVGSPARRANLLRVMRRLRSQRPRWIYRATEGYGAILRASVQPAALRSNAAREALITRACLSRAPTRTIARAETSAISRLDFPYFTRKTNHCMPVDKGSVPADLTKAIRSSLRQG